MQVSKELVYINDMITMLEFNGYECNLRHTEEEVILPGYLYTTHNSVFVISSKDEDSGYDEAIAVGVAFCSEYDEFSRVKGAELAFTRAYEQFCYLKSRGYRLAMVAAWENYLHE